MKCLFVWVQVLREETSNLSCLCWHCFICSLSTSRGCTEILWVVKCLIPCLAHQEELARNPMDLVTRVSPNQQLIRRVVWQSEQCSESYSLVKNIKKKGKCSSNLYNTEQILMKIQFYFKETDYSIYIHLQQAQAHWKIPIFEQEEMYWWTELLLPSRRNKVQRNRKKKSISLIALQLHIVFLSVMLI